MDPNAGKDGGNGDDDLIEGAEADFSDAFDEFASEEQEPPASAASDLGTDPDDEGKQDGDPQPPAPAGGENKQAAPSGPAGEPSSDPWANAPAELKAEYDRLQHKLVSVTGRLSAADRRLHELRTQGTRADGGDTGKDGGQAAEKPASFRENPKVKQLLEDYSDIAGPLVEIIEDLQGKLDSVSKPVEQFQQERGEAALTEQFQLVADRHPDLADVVNNPRYVEWLSEQPRAVREAYERNSVQVVDGEEAAWVLDMFKRDAGIETKSPTPQTPTPSPSGAAADARRQRQLDANRDSGGSRGTAQPDAAPSDDLDTAFNFFSSKAEKRRQQALGSN